MTLGRPALAELGDREGREDHEADGRQGQGIGAAGDRRLHLGVAQAEHDGQQGQDHEDPLHAWHLIVGASPG
ncbi:MAG: hypothetical protein KC457_26455 [Myxococcales bacterium]|nr:hypothetical protein [Myxococcales bacterium]